MFPLQTKVKFPSPGFQVSYHDNVFFIGSCFAENMGKKLTEAKFKVLTNPFGVNYNPASVFSSIERISNKNLLTESDIQQNKDISFSHTHDTYFSNTDASACLTNINNSITEASKFCEQINTVCVTLGTAWVYKLKNTEHIVANCHKLPADYFTRELLTVNECVSYLERTILTLQQLNPKMRFIFTVSPVRHWKDGAVENQRSKSTLLLAIQELEKSFPQIFYFPSYELLMDELRDYRFYADDMLHPSALTISIIWEKFRELFFTDETEEIYRQVKKISNAIAHKPRNAESAEHKKLNDYIKKSISFLYDKYPDIHFSFV